MDVVADLRYYAIPECEKQLQKLTKEQELASQAIAEGGDATAPMLSENVTQVWYYIVLYHTVGMASHCGI